MVDGRAMWCLLDYYFRSDNNLPCSPPIRNGTYEEHTKTSGEASIMSAANYTDAVHNFLMSQKLTTLLGKFPEVRVLTFVVALRVILTSAIPENFENSIYQACHLLNEKDYKNKRTTCIFSD